MGGKIIVWLSQIYTKICALIFILDINIENGTINCYLGKRQSTPRKVDRKFKRELLSCHSCLGCSKERLRPVFVTDAISTSHAFLPKLFSSFIDGKVKSLNGIIVCSIKRFPVSWTANMFDRTTAPRPETDDHNRLVLNVPGQQSDKSKAFLNKPRLTFGFPPFLAGIIKKRQAKPLAVLSGLATKLSKFDQLIEMD